MPGSKSTIVLTDPARQDLRDILSQTRLRWGVDKVKIYRGMVERAFDAIAADPDSGRPRHGYLRVTVGRHYIFYRTDAQHIYIVRILHDRMDAVRHLEA